MSDGIKPLDWLRDAIDDDRLTTTERAAVAAITRRAPGQPQRRRFSGQESGWDFYLSRNELAGLMAASIPTAERCLSRLHQLGHLAMVARGGRRGIKTVATVWRLAIPQAITSDDFEANSNPSLLRTSEASQPITGDDLEESPNPSGETFPTHHEGGSQPITGDTPREHRYQESADPQESTANAQLLAQLLVHEHRSTSAPNTRPTQARNLTTDRTRAVIA